MKQEIEQLQNDLDKLKAKYEESLKPKFELNRWYKDISNRIIYITKAEKLTSEYTITGYGFDSGGYWSEPGCKWYRMDIELFSLATDQEVLEALTKKCNELYKDASGIININDTNNVTFSQGGSFVYNILRNRGCFKGAVVFDSGQWATPIPKEKTTDLIPMTIDDHAHEYIRLYNSQGLLMFKTFIKYFNDNNLKIVKQ